MPEILLPTKAQVETIDTKVGTNADVAGTTTLFGRLKQSYDNISTIITNIGTVITNVGSNADASSATGSVHAKLKDIKANGGVAIDVTNCIPFHVEGYMNVAATSQYETLKSISGKGFLKEAIIQDYSGASGSVKMKITVDGSVVSWTSTDGQFSWTGLSQYDLLYPVATSSAVTSLGFRKINVEGFGSDVGGTNSGWPRPNPQANLAYPQATELSGVCYILSSPVFFKTSLLIQVMCTQNDLLNYRLQGGNY